MQGALTNTQPGSQLNCFPHSGINKYNFFDIYLHNSRRKNKKNKEVLLEFYWHLCGSTGTVQRHAPDSTLAFFFYLLIHESK